MLLCPVIPYYSFIDLHLLPHPLALIPFFCSRLFLFFIFLFLLIFGFLLLFLLSVPRQKSEVPLDYDQHDPEQKQIYRFVRTLFSAAQLTSECAIVTLVRSTDPPGKRHLNMLRQASGEENVCNVCKKNKTKHFFMCETCHYFSVSTITTF